MQQPYYPIAGAQRHYKCRSPRPFARLRQPAHIFSSSLNRFYRCLGSFARSEPATGSVDHSKSWYSCVVTYTRPLFFSTSSYAIIRVVVCVLLWFSALAGPFYFLLRDFSFRIVRCLGDLFSRLVSRRLSPLLPYHSNCLFSSLHCPPLCLLLSMFLSINV